MEEVREKEEEKKGPGEILSKLPPIPKKVRENAHTPRSRLVEGNEDDELVYPDISMFPDSIFKERSSY